MRYLTLLIFFTISLNIFSQTENEKTNESYTIVRYSNNKLKDLIFYDTINKNIIKRIDLTETNPYYKKLGLENTDWTKHSTCWYELNEVSLNSLIPPSERQHYNERNSEQDFKINHALILENVYEKSKNKIAIFYTISLTKENCTYGISSEIHVYDMQGNQVNSIKNNVNINRLALTKNGNYLCFSYGAADECHLLLRDGFKIYNLKTNKLIVDKKTEASTNSTGFYSPIDDLLIVTLNEYRQQTAIVYDFEKGKIFTRTFSKDEYLRIKSKGKDGYMMLDENGKINLETYLETFSIEEI